MPCRPVPHLQVRVAREEVTAPLFTTSRRAEETPVSRVRARTAPVDGRDATIAKLRADNQMLRIEREHYRRLMSNDEVTGLFSRAHFDMRLTHEWARAQQFWTSLSLIAVDLDDLKAIADAAGRKAAQQALAWVGEFLRRHCREVDIACRVGPWAFAVILPATNRTGAEAEMARLQQLARREQPTLPTGLCVHLSFGMAVAFDDAQTPLELLMLADEASMLDKRSCVSRHVATTPSTRDTWLDDEEPITLITPVSFSPCA